MPNTYCLARTSSGDDATFSVGDVRSIKDFDEDSLGISKPLDVEAVGRSLHGDNDGPCITDDTVGSIMRASVVDQDGEETGAFYAVKVDGRYIYFDHDNTPNLTFYIDPDTSSGYSAGNCS